MIRMRSLLAAGPVAVSVAFATCGVAHASPDVSGKTFAEASSTLSSAGYSPVVVSTIGATLGRSDCVVTRQQDRHSSSSNSTQTLLTLNCNAPLASAGVPGNSAASPEGRAAAAAATTQVPKERVEESLVGQLATGPGPAWAQCSGDLVGEIGESVDCTVLANQQKQAYTLTVTDVTDGQISYHIAPKG